MQFHLLLLFFFSSHPFFTSTYTLSNSNQTANISFSIELHQCDTNITLVQNTTITTINKIFGPCNRSCCTKNLSNQSISSNTCQVTAQSPAGACFGRLCYSGKCDQFFPSMKTNPAMASTIRSSVSSLINSTRIVWPMWRDKSHLSIRSSILTVLLIANIFLTLITFFIIIRSIRHAQMIAKKKFRRYSLF